MKVTIDIDCTPEEARAFFGLPDLGPVHAAYVERMTSFISEGLTPADIEKMMRTWLPGMTEGLDQWRQAFWSAAGSKPQS